MPERILRIRCAAKINLYLDVIGKRSDGFHDIETFFQPVSLYDTLDIRLIGQGIVLHGDDPSIAWDESNTCHRAAGMMLRRAGSKKGVSIEVSKKIPWGAGLGGGSSDAAAVLVGLDRILGMNLKREELMSMGLEIGSDVPFFIFSRPALGSGRGEILKETKGLEKARVVIVKPNVAVSTKWAYGNLNLLLTTGCGRNRLNYLLEGLKRFPDRRLESFNCFERLIVSEHPEIGEVLGILYGEGAVLASLSGSGASCFALFSEMKTAGRVERLFKEKGYFTANVRPVDQALELVRW